MPTLFANKNMGSLIHNTNSKEDNFSISDVGSIGVISTVSDSRMIRYKKRKSQKLMKDHSTRLKAAQNTFGTRHSMTKTENNRRIRSVSSHIIIPPPFLINESNKKSSGVTKEKIQVKNSAKFLLIKRKSADQKTADPVRKEIKKSTVSNPNNKLRSFEYSINSSEKAQTKLDSLIDFGESRNMDAIFCQTSYGQHTLSKTSSEPLTFENMNSIHRKNHFDYLKEFDLIRYESMSKAYRNVSKNENIFSLVPKISPSAPVTIPRRKYNRGVLSIRDSLEKQRETKEILEDEKDSNETTVKIKFENAGVSRSSEESEMKSSFNDNSSKHLNDIWLINDKSYILNVKKPIRIKCIDEVTNKMKDIVIYSDEFFKSILTEKGIQKKKEIYENILSESTNYRGKSLRIIIGAEKYCCKLSNNSKSQSTIKSATTKISKQIPMKVSKNGTLTKKRYSRTNTSNKSSEIYHFIDQTKKERSTEQRVRLPSNISNGPVGIDTADISFTQASGDSALVKNESSKSIQILEKENKKFILKNEKKSRTALKRINIESIIESSFSYYFHFHAKLGLPVKSGAAICKQNSTKWLKKCGIIYDKTTKGIAENCFRTMASAKYVLNICDYIKCLNKLARDRQMLLVEMLYQMMSVDLHSEPTSNAKEKSKQQQEPTAPDPPPETMKQLTKPKKCTKHH